MFGWMNRAALGWTDDGTPDRYTDGSNALPGGSDITSLPVVMYSSPVKESPTNSRSFLRACAYGETSRKPYFLRRMEVR